jgi:hypothetical protein
VCSGQSLRCPEHSGLYTEYETTFLTVWIKSGAVIDSVRLSRYRLGAWRAPLHLDSVTPWQLPRLVFCYTLAIAPLVREVPFCYTFAICPAGRRVRRFCYTLAIAPLTGLAHEQLHTRWQNALSPARRWSVRRGVSAFPVREAPGINVCACGHEPDAQARVKAHPSLARRVSVVFGQAPHHPETRSFPAPVRANAPAI